jgi:hypothetical protein
MRRIVVIVMCALGLAACGKSPTKATAVQSKQPTQAELLTTAAAKAAALVKEQLKDPESAKFRNVRSVPFMGIGEDVGDVFCGEVNARNAFGGYSGFSDFAVFLDKPHKEQVYIVEPGNREAKVWYDLLCFKDGQPLSGPAVTLGS